MAVVYFKPNDIDRVLEHLGAGDEGIIVLRKVLKEQIERVQRGKAPVGIIRNPERNLIIEFDVINERIGLRNQQQRVA